MGEGFFLKRGKAELVGEKKDGGHRLLLNDRKSLELNGITNVEKFDEKEIDLDTEMGKLSIKGEEMYMKHLNLDKGELIIEGFVKGIVYSEHGDIKKKEKGFFKRLFK